MTQSGADQKMADSKEDAVLHIMIVDDDEQQTDLISRGFESLPEKYRLSFARTIAEARFIISSDPPGIAFIDWRLPDGEGAALLSDGDIPSPFPIIMMISQEDGELAERLLTSGALDYLIQSDHMVLEIAHTCRRSLREWNQVQARKKAEYELSLKNEELSRRDDELQSHLTQLQSAHTLLARSEERLQLTLAVTNDGIWDWNMVTGTAIFSPRWYTMLGYEPDELPGTITTWKSLIHPEDLIVAEQKIQVHLSHKDEGYVVEVRMLTKQGDWRWILTRGKVVERDAEGRPIRMVGTHTDISERKEIQHDLAKKHFELLASYQQITANEDELRQNLDDLTKSEQMLRISEERFIMAQGIGHVGSWEYNFQTGRIWGSAEAFRIYGFPPVAGYIDIEKIEACIPDRQRVHQALVDLINLGLEYNIEFIITPFDGSAPTVVHSTARVERDAQNNQVRVVGVIQDITSLKKNENSLRETNAYLETLINYANVPIIVWDPSFKITRFNRAFEELAGLNASEVIGLSLEILFPDSSVERSMRLIRTTLEGVRWETVEIEIQHRDGSLRTVIWNSSTVYSADGDLPVATIAQGQDITAQRRLEEEKDQALGQVKQNLAQLAILNDGIRNPLTVITLNAEKIGDQRVRNLILGQTGQIDEMINQLDRRWLESEKILGYLRNHYQMSFNNQHPPNNPEETDSFVSEVSDDLFSVPGKDYPVLMEEVQAQIYTILDSIDALVYVADTDTDEILFMNRRGRGLFGDLSGRGCSESPQQDSNDLSPFCISQRFPEQADQNGVYQWEAKDTKDCRWYDCRAREIRWVDGRRVRVEIATDITGRKKVEQALELHSLIVQNIAEGVILISVSDGLIVYANPRFEQMFGYARDELVGRPVSIINAPDERSSESIAEDIINSLNQTGVWSGDIHNLRKDGTRFWCHANVSTFHHHTYGQVWLSVHEDITLRKLAEKTLRESEEKYRSLAEQVHDGIYIYQGDRFLYASTHLSEITGYSSDELLSMRFIDLIHPSDRANIREISGRSGPENLVTDQYESRIIRKDGIIRHVQISISTIPYKGGTAVLGATRDITVKKLMETSLVESEERYRQLVQNVPDYILVHRNGKILFVNEPAATSFGYSSEELIGSDLMRYLTPESAVVVAEMMQKRFIGTSLPSYEITVLTKGGRQKITEVRGVLIQYEGGPASLNVLTDITEQKQVLEALRESEGLLKTVVSHLHGVVFSLDKDGTFLLSEGSSLSTLGLVPGQVVGLSVFDVYRDVPEIVAGIQKVLTGSTWSGFCHVQELIFDTMVLPVLDDHKRVRGAVGVAIDVTERKQMEDVMEFFLRSEYLQTGEDFFRVLARYLADVLHMDYVCIDRLEGDLLSAETVAIYCDGDFEDNVRYTLKDTPCGDVVGKSVCIFSRDVRHRFPSDAVLQDMGAESYVGTTLWGFDGKPIGLIAVIGRKPLENSHLAESLLKQVAVRAAGELEKNQAEEALRESEERYRVIVSALPDVIFIFDDQGIFRGCQAKDQSQLLVPPEEFIGKSIHEIVPPSIASRGISAIEKALRTGDLQIFDYYLDLPIGRRWYEMRIVRSTLHEVLAILRDITARTFAEEALRESIQKLRLLTSLTRHDILNQVSAVDLLVDQAFHTSDIEKIHTYISRAKQESARIQATIGFTREYEGFGIVSSGWQNMYRIIESAKPEVSPGTITLDNQVPPGMWVYADPIIRKVFTTLMDNAIRHAGEITTIRFTSREVSDSVVITCEDDGIGIPEPEKERIFDHGYGHHTGIGLFLAREILSITGLSIRECGVEGKGSRFEIQVPPGKYRFSDPGVE
ncbi:MAG TPA: PAS domain S-box protein [Methanospirillum sp.]|nr:PAS domain S-box protein [Methanospirillum sp.]